MSSSLVDKVKKLFFNYPTILGFALYVIGCVWFCSLSQNELNYGTYISENALLVGQVVEKFDDPVILQQYITKLSPYYKAHDLPGLRRQIAAELSDMGLEVYEQNFTFAHDLFYPIEALPGNNLYGIMRSPSGGRTEALLITVSLNVDCSETTSPCLLPSVGLVLSLMKQFRQQLYWAKDIIVVFTESDYVGLLAFLEAYHGSEFSKYLSWTELQGRSGNIQAGLNLEFSRLDVRAFDILSEGVNGLLANLDLVNTVVRTAHKHGIEPILNGQTTHYGTHDLHIRMKQMYGLFQAVWTQASGSPSGLHGLLINYQISGLTLRGPAKGYANYDGSKLGVRFGKLIEGVLRSLNNLQELFYRSFWYYLLPNPKRYISIGVYTPPALIIISGMLIKVLQFWLVPAVNKTDSTGSNDSPSEATGENTDSQASVVSDPDQTIRKRISSSKTDAIQKETSLSSKKTSCSPLNLDLVPGVLSRSAIWIILSFTAGSLLYACPPLIFEVNKRWIEGDVFKRVFNLQPYNSDFFALSVGALFLSLAVLVPLLTKLLQRFLANPVLVYKPWFPSIALLSWALFLACSTCLNVSAGLLMSVPVVPMLLLFIRGHPMGKLATSLFSVAWILVSPPFLLLWICLIHAYYSGVSSSSITVNYVWDWIVRFIVQGLLESNLFGSWSWPSMFVGFCSLWMLTWTYSWCE